MKKRQVLKFNTDISPFSNSIGLITYVSKRDEVYVFVYPTIKPEQFVIYYR
jgi:hypothetical protein